MTDRLSPSTAASAALHNHRTNGERLWASLMELAKIGGTPRGGVHRLALTDLDRQARDLFVSWVKDAGCRVTVDRIGNIFAHRPGKRDDLPPVMTGSHIDTQPPGGKFDGCFGVMAGLEVLRSLNDLGIETEAPVEVVVWTNEEGSRFPPCMMGSGVHIGRLDLQETLARTDENGVSVGDALNAIGYAGDVSLGDRKAAAYFEAHIEQGPILEAEKKTIGVVLGTLGQKWFDVTFTGVEAHAGPTPMEMRQDALLGASEVIQAVNKTAVEHQPYGCGTVGWLRVAPNSRNVIPGQVQFSIDLRHLKSEELDAMVADVKAAVDQAAKTHGLTTEMVSTADFAPLYFAKHLVDAVREGAEALDLPHMDIVSGAGHDAVFMAEVAPTAMIFVPCEGGISHNELEKAEPADLEAGCNVLLSAVLSVAGIASIKE